MKLTKLEEQGLRLAICLSARDGQMTLPELSEAENMSEALVAKVLGKLRLSKIVVAFRGRKGGYALGDSPDKLTMSMVLKALGRPVLEGCFSTCQPKKIPCHRTEDCQLRPIWEHLENEISAVLESVTLADLLHTEEDVRTRLGRIENGRTAGAARRRPKARCSHKGKPSQAGGRS